MTVETFVILFAAATAVALLARRLGVPYTVGLVLAGLLLGRVSGFHAPQLTRDLLFSLFLPALVFEAAFHIDGAQLWKDRVVVNAMATPGLLLAMVVTAAILVKVVRLVGLAPAFDWKQALVFAAVVGATDPIAVVALFRSLGAPARLGVLVEAESLLNDGTGIVIFGIAAAAATGAAFTVLGAAVEFLRVVGLGAAAGAIVGFCVSMLIRRIDDAMIEVTLTVIAAYGSFTLADHVGGSGVISAVVAGPITRRHAAQWGMQPATLGAVEAFWEYAAFAMNSIVFLLVGLEVPPWALVASWKPIAAAWLAATVARALMVAITAAALRPTPLRLPWSWAAAVSWSGLRGALSIVLVLGLPEGFPGRALLVDMTFGFVLLTLVVQGLTMKPLLRKLGLAGA